MESAFSYILKLILISGTLYLYYVIALRNKRLHIYNRFYLLSLVVISILIPFIKYNWFQVKEPQQILFHTIVRSVTQAGPVSQDSSQAGFTTLVIIYLSVSAFLFILLVSKLIWIWRLKNRTPCIRMQGFILIETTVAEAPFSFLDNLFWRKGISLNEENGKRIFNHEMAHIRQRHTYDKLFIQLTLCLIWINPIFWLIQRELSIVHEFIADEASVEDGDTESFALMLLHCYNGGGYTSPINSFYNSSIKRRLAMIITPKPIAHSYLRRIMSLPVAILLLGLCSITLKAQPDTNSTAFPAGKNKPIDRKNAKLVDHIEVYGETGKGDTATVYFTSGRIERYFLNDPVQSKLFNKKYGTILSHQRAELKAQEHGDANDQGHIEYTPLDPIPENISEITFGSETIWLKLRDGTCEQYDLRKKADVENFEAKYGKLNAK